MNTKQIDTGGPAFPSPDSTRLAVGMSLRDWFAGMALQGWLATYGENPHPARRPEYLQILVENAYKTADAMIKERSK